MVGIKAYTKKTIYRSKSGDELPSDDGIGIMASLMSGRPAEEKEVFVYTACGETEAEAEGVLQNYLTHIGFLGEITRREIEHSSEAATEAHGTVLEEIEKKYVRPEICYLGRKNWSVRVHGFHIHTHPAMHGSFSGEGATLEKAGRNLLEQGEKFPVITGDHCDSSCPHYSDPIY